MKNKMVNNKKLITSLVSIIIVAGMAIQSLATNVDMAAFVKKDKYLSKYYELDWRIDEIEGELERLYKFTCTNVISFGGGSYSNFKTKNYNTIRYSSPSYHWQALPVLEFSTEGYLRFNYQDTLYSYGNHAKNDVFVREVPASLCKWRNGFELQPNTKVKMKITRTTPASGTSITKQMSYELIMGPFKKVPYVTATGYAGSWMSTNQFFWPLESSYNLNYEYGTETEPTSWTKFMGSQSAFSYAQLGSIYPTGFPTELRYDYDISNLGYKYENYNRIATIYCAAAMGTDLSSRTNVWLRAMTSSSTAGEYNDMSLDDLTLTTWNYDK